MNLKQKIEKFHDENRYFLPLCFISLVLMITGIFYLGPIVLKYDINSNHTLLFKNNATLLSITLRPNWEFRARVFSNKPINISLEDLYGNVVAFSYNNSLVYHPNFLNLYFLKTYGKDYVIFYITLSKSGLAPYPDSYLFFSVGYLILLGTILYYLLKPWRFRFIRKLNKVDAIFYPLMFLLVPIVFWVFRDSLIWFLPKNIYLMSFLVGLILIALILLTLLLKFVNAQFFKTLIGYFIGYLSFFLLIILLYNGADNYLSLLIQIILLSYLIILTKLSQKMSLIIFSLMLFTSILVKMLIYVVGVPLFIDTSLAKPSHSGTFVLLFVLESYSLLSIYFIIRAYFSRSRAEAIKYGLIAGTLTHLFLQIFMGTSLI